MWGEVRTYVDRVLLDLVHRSRGIHPRLPKARELQQRQRAPNTASSANMAAKAAWTIPTSTLANCDE
jgi:hypothetical protein